MSPSLRRGLSAALTLCAIAWAQASLAESFAAIDTGFGANGVVFGGEPPRALHVDSQGRIYTLARIHPDYRVGRYSATGTLDTSFGTMGFVNFEVWTSTANFVAFAFDEASSTLLMAGDEAAVGGFAAVVARYDLNGDLVTTFGGQGTGYRNLTDDAYLQAVKILSDGTIVAAGYYHSGTDLGTGALLTDTYVVRMSSTGSADNGFGTNGTRILNLGVQCEFPTAVDQDSSGRVLVGLNMSNDCDTAPAVLLRLEADGDADPTFSTAGVATLASNMHARVIVPKAAGGISVLSSQADPDGDPDGFGARLRVTQLNDDGSSAGSASASAPSAVRDMFKLGYAVHPDGKIVGGATEIENCCGQLRLYQMVGCSALTPAGGDCAGGGGGGGSLPLPTLATLLALFGIRRRRPQQDDQRVR